MTSFTGSKKDAAQYVTEALQSLKTDSQWIMIITPGTSVDCCVSIATNTSSEDIVKMLGQACYDQHMNTL